MWSERPQTDPQLAEAMGHNRRAINLAKLYLLLGETRLNPNRREILLAGPHIRAALQARTASCNTWASPTTQKSVRTQKTICNMPEWRKRK
jgi:hypothetical protein